MTTLRSEFAGENDGPVSAGPSLAQITSSLLSVFRECPRKYFYSYQLGRVRTSESKAISVGKTVHGALEVFWKSGGSLESAVAWLQSNAAGLEEPDACRVIGMLTHYQPPVEEYDVISTEETFSVPISNPQTGRHSRRYTLTGKTDGVLRRKSDGTIWVLEHKTTSEEIQGFGAYWQRLSIDHQIAYYMLATGASGVLYDVLRKPAIRPCKNETLDVFSGRCISVIGSEREKYYQFREVRKTADDIREAAGDLWQQAQLLAHSERNQFFPRNSGACRGLWGTCQFLDVCVGAARIDDDSLFRTKTAQNEELVQEVAA